MVGIPSVEGERDFQRRPILHGQIRNYGISGKLWIHDDRYASRVCGVYQGNHGHE